MPALLFVLAAITVVGALWGVHRLLMWAETRDLVYYRRKPRFRGSSLGLLESIYKPEVEHVVEERAAEAARADQSEAGPGE